MATLPSIDAIQEPATKAYGMFADSWNSHTDALLDRSGIEWVSLGALTGGGLSALIFVWIMGAVWKPAVELCFRTRLYCQCPVACSVAPEEDRLPYLYVNAAAARSRFAARNTRSAPRVRATWGQWNAMRAALGPRVPEKSVFDLLAKHGDDTRAAVDDFYGPGGHF